MLELQRLIDAAVGEAPSPDIQRVDRLVKRRRKRRVLTRTTVVGGLIVAVGALLWVPREVSRTLVTTRGTAAPATPSSVGTGHLSTDHLRRELVALGHTVRVVAPRPSEFTLFGVPPATFCVDKIRAVQVYGYASDATRTTWSRAISRDGGSIRRGNVIREILWAAPPHFFARGKLLVLYVGGDSRLVTDLTGILGATIDPGAPHGTNADRRPC